MHVERQREESNFSEIYAMDETAVWLDCANNTCVETKGAKDVTVLSTGHEKMRVTVCLTARSDGHKLLPYVLVKLKRPVPRIIEKFKGKLIINWAGSVWMNDTSTEDFLRKVIKGGGLFFRKRLLVWDAFRCHKSALVMSVLKELRVETAIIPGGCTKFIQAPDVSWNKPFKNHVRHYYNLWMTSNTKKEFTKFGNPKPPPLELVLEWIDRAWQELSKEIIVKSFEACALTTPLDGSGDDKISCFKSDGPIGTGGLDILRKMRVQGKVQDGRNDDEDAGLSYEDEDLENIDDDNELCIIIS